MNVNYIKEVMPNLGNNLLLMINTNQTKNALNFFLKESSEKEAKIILISFINKHSELIKNTHPKNFFVIDAVTSVKQEGHNFIMLKNPSDLIQIQIAIKKALQKLGDNSIIVFDSLNILFIYNSPKEIGKFVYLLTNKMKLTNNSCIFFVNNSVDEEIVDYAKQFSDKVFDFTKIASYTIQQK